MRNGRGSKAWPVRPASGHHRGGSDEEDDLAAGASRLEIAVGVGRGGEGIALADVGLEDAVTQRGEHVAGHRVQVFRGVRAMTPAQATGSKIATASQSAAETRSPARANATTRNPTLRIRYMTYGGPPMP